MGLCCCFQLLQQQRFSSEAGPNSVVIGVGGWAGVARWDSPFALIGLQTQGDWFVLHEGRFGQLLLLLRFAVG